MYDLIVLKTSVSEVEDFIVDYFRNPNEIFDAILDISEWEKTRGGDVLIEADYDTIEDLGYALESEGYEVKSNTLPF